MGRILIYKNKEVVRLPLFYTSTHEKPPASAKPINALVIAESPGLNPAVMAMCLVLATLKHIQAAYAAWGKPDGTVLPQNVILIPLLAIN